MMNDSCHTTEKSPCFCQSCTCILAMATVPVQAIGKVYEPAMALQRGTIFGDLDLPFFIGGESHVR